MEVSREQRIRSAVQAVRAGQSFTLVSRAYNIPKSTLYDHVRESRKKFSKGRTCVFSEQEEKQFTQMLRSIAQKGYRLTPVHCRKAAYLYAQLSGYKNNFDHKQKMAGRKWFSGFIKRNNIRIVTRVKSQAKQTQDLRAWKEYEMKQNATKAVD